MKDILINHITQAIRSCEYGDVRALLTSALMLAEKKAKRQEKKSRAEEYAEEAKMRNKKWQELLAKNNRFKDVDE